MEINRQIAAQAYSSQPLKPDFSSPERTYNTLKSAAARNDLNTFMDCFAPDLLFPGYLYPGFEYPSQSHPNHVQPEGVKDDNYRNQSPKVFQSWAKQTMQAFNKAIMSGQKLNISNKSETSFEIPNILMGKEFKDTRLILLFNLNDRSDGKIHQMLLSHSSVHH